LAPGDAPEMRKGRAMRPLGSRYEECKLICGHKERPAINGRPAVDFPGLLGVNAK
jgi:hypothetical protein